MVPSLKRFFIKSIIFCAIGFLIFNGKNFAASISPSDDEIFLVRNSLNPYKSLFENEFVADIERKNPKEFNEEEAFKRARLIIPTLTGFPYFSDCIFYEYDPKINPNNLPHLYEGIFVDRANPDLYVYNPTFRITLYRKDIKEDEQDYENLRIPLDQYIMQLAKAEEEKKSVLFHPLTREPFVCDAYSSPIYAPAYNFPKKWETRHFQASATIPIISSRLDRIAKRKIPCLPRRNYHTGKISEPVILLHRFTDEIKESGIRSPLLTLPKDSSHQLNPDFPDYSNSIFMIYHSFITRENLPFGWVGYQVAPTSVRVFNSAYRTSHMCRTSYKQSGMILEEYINKGPQPSEDYYRDPITGIWQSGSLTAKIKYLPEVRRVLKRL